jgi:hypothetical protein
MEVFFYRFIKLSSMKKSNIYFLLFAFGLLLNACTYDFIVKEELKPVDPTVPITFAAKIVPIFTSNQYLCSSCHKTGATAPDLTAANAYSSINTLKLIDTTTPASSKILTIPGSSSHAWAKYSASEAQLILTWIQQGAKNN